MGAYLERGSGQMQSVTLRSPWSGAATNPHGQRHGRSCMIVDAHWGHVSTARDAKDGQRHRSWKRQEGPSLEPSQSKRSCPTWTWDFSAPGLREYIDVESHPVRGHLQRPQESNAQGGGAGGSGNHVLGARDVAGHTRCPAPPLPKRMTHQVSAVQGERACPG